MSPRAFAEEHAGILKKFSALGPCPSSRSLRQSTSRPRQCSRFKSIHVPKGMPIGLDPLDNVGRQKVFCRGSIKDPFFRIGEIRKTRACTHVNAHGGLLYIDVEIVFPR